MSKRKAHEARLVSKAEMARVAGVSPQSIGSACKIGALKECMVGDQIDANHRDARAYLGGRHYPNAEDAAKSKIPDHKQDSTDYLDMTLRDIVLEFGSADAFGTWLKAVKLIADIADKQAVTEERRGTLVSRELVIKTVINPISAAHKSLMISGSTALASTVPSMVRSGYDETEIKVAIQDKLSRYLSKLRESSLLAISNWRDKDKGS